MSNAGMILVNAADSAVLSISPPNLQGFGIENIQLQGKTSVYQSAFLAQITLAGDLEFALKIGNCGAALLGNFSAQSIIKIQLYRDVGESDDENNLIYDKIVQPSDDRGKWFHLSVTTWCLR